MRTTDSKVIGVTNGIRSNGGHSHDALDSSDISRLLESAESNPKAQAAIQQVRELHFPNNFESSTKVILTAELAQQHNILQLCLRHLGKNLELDFKHEMIVELTNFITNEGWFDFLSCVGFTAMFDDGNDAVSVYKLNNISKKRDYSKTEFVTRFRAKLHDLIEGEKFYGAKLEFEQLDFSNEREEYRGGLYLKLKYGAKITKDGSVTVESKDLRLRLDLRQMKYSSHYLVIYNRFRDQLAGCNLIDLKFYQNYLDEKKELIAKSILLEDRAKAIKAFNNLCGLLDIKATEIILDSDILNDLNSNLSKFVRLNFPLLYSYISNRNLVGQLTIKIEKGALRRGVPDGYVEIEYKPLIHNQALNLQKDDTFKRIHISDINKVKEVDKILADLELVHSITKKDSVISDPTRKRETVKRIAARFISELRPEFFKEETYLYYSTHPFYKLHKSLKLQTDINTITHTQLLKHELYESLIEQIIFMYHTLGYTDDSVLEEFVFPLIKKVLLNERNGIETVIKEEFPEKVKEIAKFIINPVEELFDKMFYVMENPQKFNTTDVSQLTLIQQLETKVQ